MRGQAVTALKFIGGPKDGSVYPVESGQVLPTEIRHIGWTGHYVLVGGRYEWRGSK